MTFCSFCGAKLTRFEKILNFFELGAGFGIRKCAKCARAKIDKEKRENA